MIKGCDWVVQLLASLGKDDGSCGILGECLGELSK